jgi:arylsulfatase
MANPKPSQTNRWRCALFSAAALLTAGSVAAQDAPAIVGKTYAQSREGRAPQPPVAKGAPNIIWILLDDAGFGATSAFGGMVRTPTFDKLADGGVRFTDFHTTGICSPTRAALLTGRNHHAVGMGLFPHKMLSAEFPGYSGRLQPKDGTIADYLHAAGYSTYALGKWHLTPDEESTDLGPFDRWPTGKGFDHFFGFLSGATPQFTPDLVEDDNHVKPDGRPLNEQLVDKAIAYVDRQERINPAKPFFMYLATGATHAPHQAPQAWIDAHKGQFDVGWDMMRTRILQQQIRMGLVPKDAQLPPRDPRIPAWSSLSPDQKAVYARFMEAYAGYLDETDHEIGRFIDYLQARNLLENTVIFVILGDNGASKEGGLNGSLLTDFTPRDRDDQAQLAQIKARIGDIGTARSWSNYPLGWAQAADTPFRKWKQDADSEGATRNPLIVYWPNHLPAGQIRAQYGHVIDMLPTALEIAGVKPPDAVRGIAQTPIQGVSLTYAFTDPAAPTRHRQQYSFLVGSGSMIKDGWKASFRADPDYIDVYSTYPPPKIVGSNVGKQVWELYDLNHDFNERVNLAEKYPEKLRELEALFDAEAVANHAYPLINWGDLHDRNIARADGEQGIGNTQPVPIQPGNPTAGASASTALRPRGP